MLGFLLLLVAGVLLIAGAELFTENAARAGRRLGVTALAVGLLLAGAEPEELITALLAAARDRTAISVGDALGANVTMLTAVIGATAVLRGVPIGGRVGRYLAGAAGTGALAALFAADGVVGRGEGVVLVAVYIALVALVWRLERMPPAIGELAEVDDDDDDDDDAGASTSRGLLLAVAGVAIMAAGGWAAVEGAARVVEALGLTDGAVGATFVALATTAELFALVWSAARRNVEELAVAGVVGSAVYNATITLGVPAWIRPLDVEDLAPVAWLAAGLPLLILALGGMRRHRLQRGAGIVLTVGYVAYVIAVLR